MEKYQIVLLIVTLLLLLAVLFFVMKIAKELKQGKTVAILWYFFSVLYTFILALSVTLIVASFM